MKKDEVMNLLTEYATNERLDKTIMQNADYVEARKNVDRLFEELLKIVPPTQSHEVFDKYDSAWANLSALYAKLSYQQGLKDFFNLVVSLSNKEIGIEYESL